MIGSTCPDTPADLFEGDGRLCRAKAVAYIGLTRGAALPPELLHVLDASAIPYRLIPVSAPAHVALYGPNDVVTGTAAVLRRLLELAPTA
jgi:hypothetical protein